MYFLGVLFLKKFKNLKILNIIEDEFAGESYASLEYFMKGDIL